MINLSEKHGVNPTMPVCFWCGEEKGEVALLGELPGDIEAPRHCVLDYTPCDECLAKMEGGCMLAEVSDADPGDNRPQIMNGYWPTGRWVVITKEAAERIGIDAPRACVEEELFEELIVDVEA